MSEMPREYHLHIDAATELEAQVERAGKILERLAADLAATEPDRPEQLKEVVERTHVSQAAEMLFGSTPARKLAGSRRAPDPLFISYSTQEEDFVGELAVDLQREGVGSFVANRSIRTPALWAESIWQGLRDCRVFLLVVTAHAIRSDWCKYEVGAALALGKQVVPMLRHVRPSELPEVLRPFQALKVQTRPQQEKLLQLLKRICLE